MADPAARGPLTEPELRAYLDLVEVAGLLRVSVDRHLRETSGLSYLQFRLLTRLFDSPTGSSRMTELADDVVHSRSGLTYQAGLLESAGLVVRSPAVDDDRGVTVTITAAGRELLERILPAHAAMTRQLMFEPLDSPDVVHLADLLGRIRRHIAAMPRRLRRTTASREADAGSQEPPS